VRGLVHPLLGTRGIPNDLLGLEQARVFFVTGPNMAGKSTFLRALTLAVLLAHMGAGVPATAMATPFFDACVSCGHVVDDVYAGESSFLAEIRRVATLARTIAESDHTFAIMDEPFRGTNVHDATDATLAVLRRLVARADATVVVASHLAEIAPELDGDARVALLHFAAQCERDVPVFDFRLSHGASTQRLGMELLRHEGVLRLLEQGVESDDRSDVSTPAR
jgi:DNA mismatch repair ATPase MutS